MFNDIMDYKNYMLEMCKAHEHVYLYGAGTYGESFLCFLRQENIKVDGFITTYDEGEYFDLPVYKSKEKLPCLGKETVVILAVRHELQKEILDSNDFNCDVISSTDLEISYIDAATILNKDYFVAEKRNNKDGKILVVQLEVTFGDMIWSTAFLRELWCNFPEATIDYIVNEKFVGLYRACPYIDKIYGYDCTSLNDRINGEQLDKVKRFVNKISENGYYMAFLPRLLPLSWSDAWENILIPIHLGIPKIYGHALYFTDDQKRRCDLLEDLFEKIAKHETAHHEVEHDLEMIRLVDGSITNNRMELWPTKDSNGSKEGKIKICVALVGSIPSRSWKPEYYAEVFNNILAKYNDVEINLCGGNDAVEAAKIVQANTNNKCIDITGKTSLDDVVDLFSKCQIYVGSDTGLMHVASAFNQYVIEICASNKTSPVFWGCTPTRTGPWCDNYAVLQPEKPLDDCKYMCFKPYAHCINQIKPNEVYHVLSEVIDSIK